jgi:hypothetical protein
MAVGLRANGVPECSWGTATKIIPSTHCVKFPWWVARLQDMLDEVLQYLANNVGTSIERPLPEV